ncbi:MAG TPA: LLM class flavin-dependent oxidoreductase [Acidimicrobiales bacterium]|nr:LLM class flavin-dependent oxidoreductase [Acidimicrobiales bacterium]
MTSTRPRFSLRLNNDLTLDQYREIARMAEAAGVERLWISHDLYGASAPALLGALAEATDRLGLGIGIMNPYTVHPAELAMAAATLAEMSGGRFALGLGAGAEGFLRTAGIRRTRPLATTRQALLAVRSLLRGDTPSPGGSESAFGWEGEPRLWRSPGEVPIYLAATGPRMRALAGELADGVLALALPPETYPDIVSQVGAGVTGSDRECGPDVPLCVWVSVAPDLERAREALAPKLALYGREMSPDLLDRVGLTPGDFGPLERAWRSGGTNLGESLTPAMERLAVVGDPDRVAGRCSELLVTGVDHLSFGPPFGTDPVAGVGLLLDEVLPRL